MSTKVPVLHSLVMSAGAFAKNFKVEVFAVEPTITEAGRLYFVNGSLKFSYLDGQGALATAVVATGSGLADALAALSTSLDNEVARATAAEAALQSDIDTVSTDLAAEVTRATGAEGTLTTNLAAEVTRATGAEAALQTAIDAEATTARAAEAGLASDIAAEETRALAAEAGLQTAIDGLAASKADITYVDSKISALGNAFQYVGMATGGVDSASAFDLSTLTERAAGAYYKVAGAAGSKAWFKVGAAGTPFMVNGQDGMLFNSDDGVDVIDTTDYEVNGSADILVSGNKSIGYTVSFTQAALDRFTALQTAIDAEETRALAAEAGLQSAIDAEAATARAAEQANATAIADETTRATAAEAGLQSDIDAEVTRATGAEAALQSAITALQSSSSGAVADLKTALNGKSLIYTASSDVKDHTFTHNLGHTDYVATVVELDVDGVTMLNSFVPYEATANAVIASLAANGKVKIFIQDLSDLA